MHRQIGILLKKLASGVARSIQKGLCITVSLRSTTQVSFCRSTRFDYRSIGRSSKAAHSDMKSQNTVPLSQASVSVGNISSETARQLGLKHTGQLLGKVS